jgi:hypothetical protein
VYLPLPPGFTQFHPTSPKPGVLDCWAGKVTQAINLSSRAQSRDLLFFHFSITAMSRAMTAISAIPSPPLPPGFHPSSSQFGVDLSDSHPIIGSSDH